uniref:U4/U6 snRNA-associated-splicing factor PRP24 n=10 Tax=Ophiostoma TaxID=5159 RepID=SART3_OPHUL|nr:colony 1 [Ophiostoma ulmi]
MERIKHAATNSSLDRDGMAAVVDMYATWCGYLRRCAMDPNASDESVDLADSGLVAALEAVQVWGERRFGSAFQGDPNYRLERIMIYHLTEKHGAIDEAREHWDKLAQKELLAHDYSFWLSYYMWEMNLLQSQKGTGRSPTPAPAARLSRTPSRPASILQRALQVSQLNWPERVIEIYVKHCNDFESSDVLQNALDEVHNLQRVIAQRRKDATAAQTAQAEAHARAYESQALEASAAAAEAQALGKQQTGDPQDDLNAGVKRKWEAIASGETPESATKKPKNEDIGVNAAAPNSDQKSQENQPAKRDRENTSVFVSNLPSDVTITKVRQYFREYGHVNNIQLKHEENGKSTVALVEFRSVEDAQTALIRDGKYFGDHTISVKEAAGITLYVTNFPPSTDDESLHRLFGKSSNIFGIRWPSLKYNAHRRFCYVSFRDAESAAKATGLHGKMLEGKYKLSVQYSDPAAKKAREGATDEGREVHIKNIPQEFDEKEIEQLVSKYGTVKRVRLLHNMAGRSRGSAFVDLETKDEAERVVAELDKVKLGTQILKVELSVSAKFKPSARETSVASESATCNGGQEAPDEAKGEAGNEARGNLHLRSFALLGIPDTVNITRVRSLAEPHGHITKLKLYPEHGGAIIEYEDETTAGKAQLALDSTQLEGHTLRVDAVPQLFKEKSGVRIDRVDIAKRRPPKPTADTTSATMGKKAAPTTAPALLPAFVRRPVLGGKGVKHGLGFSAISATTSTKKDGQPTATNGAATSSTSSDTAPKKSNADFRALFLAGKSSTDSKEKVSEEKSKASGAPASVDKPDSKPDDTKMEIDVVVNGH